MVVEKEQRLQSPSHNCIARLFGFGVRIEFEVVSWHRNRQNARNVLQVYGECLGDWSVVVDWWFAVVEVPFPQVEIVEHLKYCCLFGIDTRLLEFPEFCLPSLKTLFYIKGT